MNPNSAQNLCQVGIVVFALLSAICGYGSYKYGKQIDKDQSDSNKKFQEEKFKEAEKDRHELSGEIARKIDTGNEYLKGIDKKIDNGAQAASKKEPIVYLDGATIKPLLVNGKEDYNNYKISFVIKNIGDSEITITKYKIYTIDLDNHKYEMMEEEISPQVLYPKGPPISPYLVGYTKEMINTYRYFILIVEYANKSGDCYFRKLKELKILPSTYDMDLLAVNKEEEKLLEDMLKYLIKEGKEKSEYLKRKFNI